jgi:MscS family membrane protein
VLRFLTMIVIGLAVLALVSNTLEPPARGGPLAPPDTSSPRAALDTFHKHSQAAEDVSWAAANEIRSSNRFTWTPETYKDAHLADVQIDRAARTLDLTGILPAVYERKKIESVLLLNEILDRVRLPPTDQLPGDDKLASWTIPGTEIRLVKMTEGPRAGDYLFSPDTIARLPEFYQKVRNLPSLSGSDLDYYQYYARSPGGLIPPAWFHQIQKRFFAFGQITIGHQAGWQWVATLLSALLLGIAVQIARKLSRWLEKSLSPVLSVLGAVLFPASIWAAADAFVWMLNEANIIGNLYDIFDLTATTMSYIARAWVVMAASLRIAELAHLWMKGQSRFSIDASLARTLIRVTGFMVALAILAQGLSQLGVPLMGIIAGLGIGGLAIALAAQPTIENLIGGVMLYLDRPVRVGDWCEFGEHRGVVEEIGLRSTRIRTRDKTLITVTNADFAKMKIINLSRGDRSIVRLSLNLPYDMPVENLEKLLNEMRSFLASHSTVDPETASVYLSDLSNSAAKVQIAAEIIVQSGQKLSPIREELLLGLARIADRYDGRRLVV